MVGSILLAPVQVCQSWAFYTAGGVVHWIDTGVAKVPSHKLDRNKYDSQLKEYLSNSAIWQSLL
jgi:hypothetical protein